MFKKEHFKNCKFFNGFLPSLRMSTWTAQELIFVNHQLEKKKFYYFILKVGWNIVTTFNSLAVLNKPYLNNQFDTFFAKENCIFLVNCCPGLSFWELLNMFQSYCLQESSLEWQVSSFKTVDLVVVQSSAANLTNVLNNKSQSIIYMYWKSDPLVWEGEM